MTWKEFKDWIEKQGITDDMEFDPSVEEDDMEGMKILIDSFGIARIVYK